MNTSAQSTNILTRLFGGQMPLVRAYWIYSVIIGGLVLGLGVAYVGLSQVGVWRSANRYPGPALWRYAAKASVIGTALLFVWQSLAPANESPLVQYGSAGADRDLPALYSDGVRLDRITLVRDSFFYDFIILEPGATEASAPDLARPALPQLFDEVCSPDFSRRHDAITRIFAQFRDRDGFSLTSLVIDLDTCPEPPVSFWNEVR